MARVFTITEGLENMGALKTGGQGSVYKARRIGEIITAVKIIPTPIYGDEHADKNYIDFQNEVTKLKRVNEKPNPNVVKIISSGLTESGSFPFIEMDFIEGPDLEELLKAPHDPIFTIKEVIKVAEQLSNALAHCHRLDVKHGDIKSNNVKFNIHTGNYVLLDFGLAAMSDEQRRTSLRHAGAIEFMAPEQSEGHTLMQTDIYSFGVILYELLAGVVPFPLTDRGEMARNTIMLAHLETPPPSIMPLRQQHLPEGWSEEKKAHEMRVPDWFLKMIARCLEKKPEARFANGSELHDYIVRSSIIAEERVESNADQVAMLQVQNVRLQRENKQLQELIGQYQAAAVNNHRPIIQPSSTNLDTIAEAKPYTSPVSKRKPFPIYTILTLLALGLFFLWVFVLRKSPGNDKSQSSNNTESVRPRTIIGQYKVIAPRAYFHDEPDVNSRRSAYMVPSNEVVSVLDSKNGFFYTEFTNNRGQTSKGWLREQDLVTVDEWERRKQNQQAVGQLTEADIQTQLQEARDYIANRQIPEALHVYNFLAQQNVPEAMYEYGSLALQRRNQEISCGEGFDLVKKASDKGYTPAKRTLGFLYLFADNEQVLRLNNYETCQYEKNVFRGSKLLMEAIMEGDTTAKRLMEEFNQQRTNQDSGEIQ
ncbi:serine/threonine-protein kinase [Flavisolibacter tropicus]|uniref:serine/threonine-protein kinase n=1 Tax=Flavisolibacter tropicus TaxID=1492898 RepID=UPI0009EF698A|nr:serine/threonine-protein kinase [Flavisolibacter tropicus]